MITVVRKCQIKLSPNKAKVERRLAIEQESTPATRAIKKQMIKNVKKNVNIAGQTAAAVNTLLPSLYPYCA